MASNNIRSSGFYKRFNVLVIVKLLLLIINVITISKILGDKQLFFTHLILGLILIFQFVDLLRFLNHTNRELERFFLAIRHSDFSINFKQETLGRSFSGLQQSMTDIIDSYKQVKIEKEAQFHFLQMLISHLHIGLIALENDKISLINTTAQELMNMDGVKDWKLFQQLHPTLSNEILAIGNNGSRLVEIKQGTHTGFISVHVSTSIILGKETRLITFQNINSEIEQKEIEAWHKLIRILTHEIMNSVTPISSLTETMQMMLQDKHGNPKRKEDLTDDVIHDIRFSLSTIQKRSDGLLHFIENYRKLTRVPKPKTEPITLRHFFNTIQNLLKHDLEVKNINLSIEVSETLTLDADPVLLEQVIINLISNSMHALDKQPKPAIELKGYQHNANNIVIEVKDNGRGIPAKELSHIFTPFFSTRKDGSGIGLSLSKQIMSDHGGSIKAISEVDLGTTMLLLFKVRK